MRLPWKLPLPTRRWFPALLIVALLAATVPACAPASGPAGIDVGKQSPPFAMTLADGTKVTSADLTGEGQPVHLFWFATW